MTMRVEVEHRLGTFKLAAMFETSGGLTALYGDSGSGKTTLVNTIAGLIAPQKGIIVIDDVVLFDSDKNINIPSHKRRIGYVFQDARLFPHFSVKQNLLYGKWFAARSNKTETEKIIDLLGLGKLLHRMPHNLSGGERQRVGMGRALLSSPRLLLMDEPLASLDDARKLEIMPYIEQLRDEMGIPIIYVSHSVSEVMALATKIVLMSHGKTTTSGTPSQIFPPPTGSSIFQRNAGRVLLELKIESFNRLTDTTLLSGPSGKLRIKGYIGKKGETVEMSYLAAKLKDSEP